MKLEFLPPPAVKPRGWLLRQLRQQGDGLNGNLDKVWRDVSDSKWLGGGSDGWERLPYFLDGFIPLAYLLDDEDKKARAASYINCILEGQDESGCFYPKGDAEKRNGDIWSFFLVCKVLTVYADCSGDPRIEDALARGLSFLDGYIKLNPPYNWAAARWYECLIPILWLYRRRKEGWLLRLAGRLRCMGMNYDYAAELWDEVQDGWSYDTHVVNIAMALKSEALYCELSGDQPTGQAERMLEKLFARHGTAYMHFTGDECLSGTSPSQGSELCGVVEAMYSYEWLTSLTGEAKWGDILEGLAFNALPASVSADMWTHQYDQQVNQIACVDFSHPIFRTNNGQSNLFGLEPNFGCCTANFGQGFPKLALSAYMRAENGIAVVSPLPAEIQIDGATLVCESEYPFRSRFTLTADRDLSVRVRVPFWTSPVCEAAFTQKDGWMYFRLKAGTPVKTEFPAQARIQTRPEGRVCVKYGALLFALPIAGKKTMREYTENGVERKFPYCDYTITPTGEWRYALAGDQFEVEEREYGLPFDRNAPPLIIRAEFAPVEWAYEEGHDMVAARRAGSVRRGENVTLAMQPYGATDLRITETAFIK